MTTNERLTAVREDFESGKNPLAFIPYALALRQEHQIPQAVEVCLQGVNRHPESIAGRTLLGRLYCDIGRYQESRSILETLNAVCPDALGVRLALARTLLRMQEIDDAQRLVEALDTEFPHNPEVRLLVTALRRLVSYRRRGVLDRNPDDEEVLPTTVDEVLEAIVSQVGRVLPVNEAMLVSLQGAFESVRIGECESLRAASEAFREILRACDELEMGDVIRGQFDFEATTLLFARRNNELVLLALNPGERLGRAGAVFYAAVSRLLPLTESTDTVSSEVEA